MKITSLLIVLLISIGTSAQTSLGIISEPTLNITSIGSDPSTVSDSMKGIRSKDYSLSLGLEIRKQIDKNQAITFIPGFQQSNMLLVLEDLQLFDEVHPSFPVLKDFSQGASKNAFLHYRFKYVGTQILYSRRFKSQPNNRNFNMEYSIGTGLYYLLGQDIRLRTEAFAIQNEFTHIITDSIAYIGNDFSANLIGTIDLTYKITPKFKFISGGKLNIPLLATTSNLPEIKIFNPALRFGIRMEL